MKKILIGMFLLVFCLCFVGCDLSKSNNPTIEMIYGDWYNCAKLPSMEDPFAESYDGSYTIKIDENNDVSFKSINQEELKGKLEFQEKSTKIDIKIIFDNNSSTSSGYLSIMNDSPYLQFFYKGVNYCFTNVRSISKDEFETYRTNFSSFLRDSFINNSYPTIEEVEKDSLYREYTNFAQIDPCCNGPKIYTSVSKISIVNELVNDEICATYNDGKIENININEIDKIVLVKTDGTFECLDKVQEGQCFFTSDYNLYYFEIENNEKEGCLYEWSTSEEGHSRKMLCDCCDAPAVDEPHEDIDGNQICDVCGYTFNTAGINGIYTPEIIASLSIVNNNGVSNKILEDYLLWIQNDTLYLDSCIFEDGKIGKFTLEKHQKLSDKYDLNEFYYVDDEYKDLVKELFNQESYYSIVLGSYLERVPGHYLIELNGDLYYIYTLFTLGLSEPIYDVFVFRLNN